MPCRKTILAFAALLLLSACSTSPRTSPDTALFVPDSQEARVYLYAVYDNPADKPFFNETFRFGAGGYEGDVGAGQFIETLMSPGDYGLHVDQIDWGGYTINPSVKKGAKDPATLKVTFAAGRLYFLAAHVGPNRLVLSQMPEAEGREDVLARTRKCLCTAPMTERFVNWLGF